MYDAAAQSKVTCVFVLHRRPDQLSPGRSLHHALKASRSRVLERIHQVSHLCIYCFLYKSSRIHVFLISLDLAFEAIL